MAFLDAQVMTALCLTLLGALGTLLGGLLVIVYPGMTLHQLGILQGIAGGLMMSISFMDLLPDAIESLGFFYTQIGFYVGAAFFAILTAVLPDPDLDSMLVENETDKSNSSKTKRLRREILMSGLITALGIALHNFPEGVSVFLASLKSPMMGLNLAIAIAIHNIPEGVAVALPVYFATKSRWTGFKYATLSGMAEPLAVVIMAALMPFYDADAISGAIDFTVAGVGGIMVYITIHELMPLSLTHCGKTKMTIATLFGMALMSINLYFLHG